MEAQDYRVWDRRARRMLRYPDDGIILSRLPGQKDHEVRWYNPVREDWDLLDEAEVNNATPFHDCHGRLIFENDILRTPYGHGRVYMSRDTGQWMVQLDIEIPELFTMPREYTEISGTVYLNPELILHDAGWKRTDEEA
jgi:hypothetical protein